jgi:multiple sugar transport system ATP-binding protein
MEIYSRPANTFVSRFVGSPAMTIAPAERIAADDGEFAVLKLGDGTVVQTRVSAAAMPKGDLRVGIRPEAVHVGKTGSKAKVELVERLGERTLVYARLSDGQPIIAEDAGDSRVKIGDEIALRIDGAAAHVFDAEGRGYHRAES